MRDLTSNELQRILKTGRCLFCDGEEMYVGPQGGMMTNFYCANEACEAGFNLPPANVPIGGQVIRDSKLPPTERAGVESAVVVRLTDALPVSRQRPWVLLGLMLLLIVAVAVGLIVAAAYGA